MITPQLLANNLAKKIGLTHGLYLKREDLHPFNSHKGRSIPLMIQHYVNKGISDFVISSSGNAALAAVYSIDEIQKTSTRPLTLIIYAGKNINLDKLALIKKVSAANKNITIKSVTNPKQSAFLAAKSGSTINLRQSTDDLALLGYEELAKELADINGLTAVFIPTSSGTLADGLHRGFKKINLNPQIHIIQTTACHPFTPHATNRTAASSLATAIVDQVGHRSKQIQKALIESDGKAWVAEDEEITEAIKLSKQCEGIEISPNSALSIAGLKKAVANGLKFNGPVVCLLTGP